MGTGSGGGEGRGRAGKGLAMKAGVEERKGRGDVPGTMSSISSRAAEVESALYRAKMCCCLASREAGEFEGLERLVDRIDPVNVRAPTGSDASLGAEPAA